MKKYCDAKSLVCQGFITMYCKGEKQAQCQRKQYKATHGTPPPDNMMPSGQMIAA